MTAARRADPHPVATVADAAELEASALEQVLEEARARNPHATNAIATNARRRAQAVIAAARAVAAEARAAAEHATTTHGDPDGCLELLAQARAARRTVRGLHRLAQRLAAAVQRVDVAPEVAAGRDGPPAADWATIADRVLTDTLQWGAAVRDSRGQLLILCPTAGTGKTHSLCAVALQEQRARQRVVLAPRNKEIIRDELEPRLLQMGGGHVHLHVLEGRSDETCDRYASVHAAQINGHAPGRVVCPGCERWPPNAMVSGLRMCRYYQTRVDAERAIESARRNRSEYPLILTTHATVASVMDSGGRRYGSLIRGADLILLDEDPTEALEREVVLTADDALYTSDSAADRPSVVMAAMARAAIEVATAERAAMEGHGWRDANRERSPIHTRHGSVYAGLALLALLDRVATGVVGQRYGVRSAEEVLAGVADAEPRLAPGELADLRDAEQVRARVAPRNLSLVGGALHAEITTRRRYRHLIHRELLGREIRMPLSAEAAGRELSEIDLYDTAYQTRLEYTRRDGWRFVYQHFVDVPRGPTAPNIVVGDAYAIGSHYRRLFGAQAPATQDGEPDRVTVIRHVAQLAPGTRVLRVQAPARIGKLQQARVGTVSLAGEETNYWLALVAELFRQLPGKSVLIYAHQSLRRTIEDLCRRHSDFGMRWEFEHLFGGRGMDGYREFDVVAVISEPIQHVGTTLHRANARAARDARLALDAGALDLALHDGQRIAAGRSGTTLAHALKPGNHVGNHWRVVEEHIRQNVHETSQALHRVRPAIAPRLLIVLGDALPLTAEFAAVAETLDLTRSRADGFLTEEEAYVAARAIYEHFGVWSGVFVHALLRLEIVRAFEGGMRGAVCRGEISESVRDSVWGEVVDGATGGRAGDTGEAIRRLIESGGDTGDAMSIYDRVEFPPAEWDFLRERAMNSRRIEAAHKRLKRELPESGFARPSWGSESSTSHGYEWHGHSRDAGLSLGRLLDRYHVAPGRKPVPF